MDLGHPVIASSHINNLQIKLINGSTISLKGGDRPETMRGVSLKFLVLDEYADIKSEVWEQILRPALADQKAKHYLLGHLWVETIFMNYINMVNLKKILPISPGTLQAMTIPS